MATHALSQGGFSNGSPIDSDVKTQTPTQDSDSEPEEEARPSHTAEIGTLKKLSVPGGTAWLGSSSGVYFVNTVRRAFSAAFSSNANNISDNSNPETVPASEDIITGEDAAGRSFNGASNTTSRNAWWLPDADFHRRIVAAVGRPPADQNVAMELVTHYFRTTHPLFPFLHGPKFLEEVSEIYAALSQQSTTQPRTASKPATSTPRPKRTNSTTTINSTILQLGNIQSVDPLKLITFQIIINIAALSHGTTSIPVPSLPTSSTIPSPQALLTLILPLSTTPLLPTIQLLLAAELYLLSTISLRHSSTLAGLVLRLIYHAGLHRCPLRYASLTPQDCEIRKRIFWSAYALDRHLSLALGDPNTFQDSDIDVCLSRDGDGEMHRAVARDLLTEEEKEVEMKLHYPRDGAGKRVILIDSGTQNPAQRLVSTNANENGGTPEANKSAHHTNDNNMNTAASKHAPESVSTTSKPSPADSSPSSKQLREAALTAYVRYGKLTGRIIEIFHKSINFRFPKEDAISFLSADIENWWNDLPSTLTGDTNPNTSNPSTTNNHRHTETNADGIPPGLLQQHKALTPFFTLLYHQLLLLLNRPKLSLDQSTASFQQGLQTCIRASRATLTNLHLHRQNGQSMFLPGLLSATWMAGLIIAFACQLGKYPKLRAVDDIEACLGLLGGMGGRGWYTVRNCARVLELLVGDIRGRKANSAGLLVGRGGDGLAGGMAGMQPGQTQTRKRTHDSFSIDNTSEAEPSPKRDSLSGASPASITNPDFRAQRFRTSPDLMATNNNQARNQNLPMQTNNSNKPTTTSLLRNESTMSNSTFDFASNSHTRRDSQTHTHLRQHQPLASNFQNMPFNSNLPPSLPTTTSNATPTPTPTPTTQPHQTTTPTTAPSSGAALYADPQDIALTQSTHSLNMSGLPDMPGTGIGIGTDMSMDDPMFWGNMDSNLFDVFGAVSWENMTGPVGPMGMGMGGGGGNGGGGGGISMWDFGMGMTGFGNAGGGGGNDGPERFT